MKLKFYMLPLCLIIFLMASCSNKNKNTSETDVETVKISVPTFNADSAFLFVKAQTDFGPRTPNSAAHKACGDYLAAKLESFGAKVISQNADLMGYDGTILKGRNIIGSFKPENPKRILLCSHWDSRPWADNDPDEKKHHTPIDGANDGASGVGVLLEMARLIQQQQPELGIDIIFFDMEDYGTPQWAKTSDDENSWCLGSQYWARNPHTDGYNARFGILLDMVGGANATFYQEQFSLQFAKGVVNKVWNKANNLGYGAYFLQRPGGAVTDDHIPVNTIARIPCIDIIPYDTESGESSFGATWHTVNDNIDHIDKKTLEAVGRTLMEIIYNEK